MYPQRLTWHPSTDPDVLTGGAYIVRWAIPPASINYEIPGTNVGLVTEVNLPLLGMPSIVGQLIIAVTSMDDIGDESDTHLEETFDVDFRYPSMGIRTVNRRRSVIQIPGLTIHPFPNASITRDDLRQCTDIYPFLLVVPYFEPEPILFIGRTRARVLHISSRKDHPGIKIRGKW